MVDFVSLALDIMGAAKTIKDTIDEVRGFKTRSRRLCNRIQCLMPAVQLLAEMKDKQDELTAVITHSFGEDIKLFGCALEELKKSLEEAKLFIESLYKMDALTKAWRKREINGQFDWFGDHLNELQGTIQFGILVEMREVLYGHAAKEEIRRQMEMIKEESKKLFERRRDEDLEDEMKDQMDQPSLLETMALTASDINSMSSSVQEVACTAKQFKNRCQRLSNSIMCLMPSMLVLVDTQSRKCELSAIRMQDSDLELKVIAQSLGQLKDCVQGARVFLEPFKYMDIITKTMNKGLLKRQFCMFSERLDVLQKSLDYDLLTAIIKRLGKGDTLRRRKKAKRVPAYDNEGEPNILKPEIDLLNLSRKIAFHWEDLGVYLGLHQYCIKSINSNYRYQCVQEKAFDMLVKWREYVPRDVDGTMLLARALRACDMQDVAKELGEPSSNLLRK